MNDKLLIGLGCVLWTVSVVVAPWPQGMAIAMAGIVALLVAAGVVGQSGWPFFALVVVVLTFAGAGPDMATMPLAATKAEAGELALALVGGALAGIGIGRISG